MRINCSCYYKHNVLLSHQVSERPITLYIRCEADAYVTVHYKTLHPCYCCVRILSQLSGYLGNIGAPQKY